MNQVVVSKDAFHLISILVSEPQGRDEPRAGWQANTDRYIEPFLVTAWGDFQRLPAPSPHQSRDELEIGVSLGPELIMENMSSDTKEVALTEHVKMLDIHVLSI